MTPGAVGRAPAKAVVLLTALALAGAGCASGAGTGPDRRAYRRVQRAYDGAPPVIPHAVEALQRQDCLACHAEGLLLPDGGLAPRTPHPENVNCRQCHVEQPGRGDGLAANRFAGLRYPGRGTRAYAGAPPTIPHPLAGRRNCLGCHGDLGGSPIRTPHPDRVNCAQCHVPQADVPAWRANVFQGTAP
jgi:cytochrome c-type protein NapB